LLPEVVLRTNFGVEMDGDASLVFGAELILQFFNEFMLI
jgi:hypothetical protein